MSGENPQSGKSHLTIVACATLVVIALVLAATAPYAWYWRIAIFFGCLLVIYTIYPKFRAILTKPSTNKRPCGAKDPQD